MDMCSSPQLFAAYHVLLRLPVPRHPPDALVNLTINCLRTRYTQGFLHYCLSVSEFLVSQQIRLMNRYPLFNSLSRFVVYLFSLGLCYSIFKVRRDAKRRWWA